MVLISIYETGHIWAIKLRGYNIPGLVLSVFGPGVYQDKPLRWRTEPRLLFRVPFFTFPIYLYAIWPNLLMFVYLTINASAISVIDLYA